MSNFSKKCLDIIAQILLFVILFGLDEYVINYLFYDQKYYIIITLSLLAIIITWFRCNINKKSILFYSGLVYITIPMVYWCFNKSNIETLLLFFWLAFIYNIFGFILFKIVSGLQININRKSLKLVINIISALLISLYKLNLGFPNNGYISILKDYKLITTVFFTVILVTSDLLLMKIKPLLENDNMMKELQTTESIFPTGGIWIQISNSFLFISYIYIIYVIVLRCICKLII